MASKFENDYLELSTENFIALMQRYIKERYVKPEVRLEAINLVMKSAIELMPEDLQDDLPRLLPMSAFLDAIGETPAAIVGEYLPAKKLICFSGAAKEGKSLVALEMLENIATGNPLFGMHEIDQQGAVAYFGMEDGGYEIKDRLIARGVQDISNYYICWQSFDMKTPLGWQQYLAMVEPIVSDMKFLVIDTAREAFRGIRDWNDAAQVGPVISVLRRWAHKHCTVLLIAHNNKDKFAEGVNKISGSSALISSCDGFMILDNQTILDNGDLQWNLEMGGRSVKRTKRFLRMDTHTLRVTELSGDDIDAAKQANKNAEKNESKKRILAELSEIGGKTARDIGDAANMTPEWVSRLLKELIETGLVHRAGMVKAEGSKRPVQLYVLASKEKQHSDTDADNRAKSAVDDFFNAPETPPETEEGKYDVV